jgi:DnaJ-class molecular chaperone
MNYYEILGVKKAAKPDEIRRAYRQLVLKLHPDQSGQEDSAQFRKAQEAYEVLSDPGTRQAYDRSLGERVRVRNTSRSWSSQVTEVTYSTPASRHFEVREIFRKPASHDAYEEWFRSLWEEFFNRF